MRRCWSPGDDRWASRRSFSGGRSESFAQFHRVGGSGGPRGGAAIERRKVGETVADITKRFPHWFCSAFAGYAGREQDLPCDAHVLLAMTAPRPLYVASAIEDTWADPEGEFLAAAAAEPAWKLFGLTGLGTAAWPPVNTPVGDLVGYHVRTGKHDLLEYDWLRFADFADRHLPPPGQPEPKDSGTSGR